MKRKKRAKQLFGLKVLAICGAAVFMVKASESSMQMLCCEGIFDGEEYLET